MTTKAARKIMRKNNNNNKKKILEREVKAKMGMFDILPDKCLNCQKPFDKQDKTMVQSWYTVVYNEKKKVNLYCPECWIQGQEILHDFRERTKNKLSTKR